MIQPQIERQYHFVKVLPTTPSILVSPGMLFQRKFDGFSTEVFIDNSDIRIIGKGILEKKQSDYTEKFPELVKEIKRLNIPSGTDFLPEIIVVNPRTGIDECSLVQTRIGRESNIGLFAQLFPALMIIHDVASVAGIDLSKRPYFERINPLKQHIVGKSDRVFIVSNSANGIAEWEHVKENKLEGLIIRDPKAPLGYGVLKLKREFTEDVYCKGEFTSSDSSLASFEYEIEGKKMKGLFANLICYQLTKEGKEIQVCEVGGGFTTKQRVDIQKMLDLHSITKDNPLIMEIKANMRYPNLKLRHPTFLRIRNDKPWHQCTILEAS